MNADGVCIQCGKSGYYVEPRRKRLGLGKFCSYKCRGAYKSAQPSKAKKLIECRACKKLFLCFQSQIIKGSAKYCSRACSQAKFLKICAGCGKRFRHRYLRKYCSDRCVSAARTGTNSSRWKPEAHTKSICVACGKEITNRTLARNRVVCSLLCWGRVRTKLMGSRNYTKGKGGRRADLDNRYFRSRWEANWARYLNWLVKIEAIKSWEYEPETFEFPVKRGNRTYTPDFKLHYSDGRSEIEEVKGYMDAASATKLERMAKYYPEVLIRVIDGPAYKSIAKQFANSLPNWEKPESNKKRWYE